MKKMLVVSVAGLDKDTAAMVVLPPGVKIESVTPPFPAVTCTSQATFRTASPPQAHGMVANGIFDRSTRKASFWEQSAALVEGERIWDGVRNKGGRVALLFWQQSLGEAVDYVLSPAPIHKHHGGMILDCYSQPRSMYERLRGQLGVFPLQRYWGPGASARVGDWIARATASVLAEEAAELVLTYLPTLDYDYQRFGCDAAPSQRAREALSAQLEQLFAACAEQGYEWVVWGDYAIEACRPDGVIYPNRLLRDAGLLKCRDVRGHLYADLYSSRAFAMVDHAVAHVFVPRNDDVLEVAQRFVSCPGVARVFAGDQRSDIKLRHDRCGDVVLQAEPGCWFAYPWWYQRREAPDFASHVDIHNKPGFDPCELFMQWLPPGVSQDSARIGGTHGRADITVAWAASVALEGSPASLADLGAALRQWLEA
jgi:predicted AlkP superfamily pyrophosphatase or phosphodiesterase